MSRGKQLEVGQIIKSTNYTFKEEKSITQVNGPFGRSHRRLRVFHHKGLKCSNPACNHVGTRLILGVDTMGGFHWDIYTTDLQLMNIDHIVPKNNGGNNHLTNLQPMCMPCNSKKGHKTIENGEIANITTKRERMKEKRLLKQARRKLQLEKKYPTTANVPEIQESEKMRA